MTGFEKDKMSLAARKEGAGAAFTNIVCDMAGVGGA